MDTSGSVQKNREHFDRLFAGTDVEKIVGRIRNHAAFLQDAIRTDTSWHGMYQGGFAERLRGKRVLELGSGDGTNALIMATLGADVTALDISESSRQLLDEAGKRLGLHVRALCGDFLQMEFPRASYDFVVGKSLLHHLTHEWEDAFLARAASLLKPDGEARFFEPAVNSKLLDDIRYAIPVPRRPSSLRRRAFREWKAKDPHPDRDNSTAHYVKTGGRYFDEILVVFIGSIERLERVIPAGTFNRRFRRLAHRIEPHLPTWFRRVAARSQLIVYRSPKS